MIDAELLASIKRIELKARKFLDDTMSGQYTSAFKGRGMEFDEVREYQVGDETRFIDWNVTARMGQPYVKLFRQERSLTVHLVVDVSASQSFGTGKRSKKELSAQLAAMVTLLASQQNDSVSVTLVSDQVEFHLPARKGRGQSVAWNIVHKILSHEPISSKTDLSSCVELLTRRSVRRGLVIIISDFCGDAIADKLFTPIRKRHDLLAFVTADKKQYILPPVPGFAIEDAESGDRFVSKSRGSKYSIETAQKQTQHIENFLKSASIDFAYFYPDEDPVMPMGKLFARHGGRVRL